MGSVLKKMRAPRTLKITREGRYYLGFTLGVGIAATNTGNNLLFLILGMMLALIIVSGLLSEAALRRLEVRRSLSGAFRAGEPSLTTVILHNGNRLLPSMGLEVKELPNPKVRAAPGRCLRVLAGATDRAGIRLTPSARGEIDLAGLEVTTRYPFGIFAKSRRYELPGRIVAWPEWVSASPLSVDGGREDAGPPVASRSGVEDLRGLRRFRDGDETRLVHWRRSLRVGRMLVVERDSPEGRRVRLVLKPGRGEPFEDDIRLIAARAEEHLSLGDEVEIDAPAGFSVPLGRGPGHRRRILFALALVPQSRGGKLAGTTEGKASEPQSARRPSKRPPRETPGVEAVAGDAPVEDPKGEGGIRS